MFVVYCALDSCRFPDACAILLRIPVANVDTLFFTVRQKLESSLMFRNKNATLKASTQANQLFMKMPVRYEHWIDTFHKLLQITEPCLILNTGIYRWT